MAQWGLCDRPADVPLAPTCLGLSFSAKKPRKIPGPRSVRARCGSSARTESPISSHVVKPRFGEARKRCGQTLNSPNNVDGAALNAGFIKEESVQEAPEQERRPSSPTAGYFEDAPSDELLGMFRSLTVDGRLDAALEVLRRLVQADRHDVLGRVRHKDFLRRAADSKAVKQAFRFIQVLPREYVDARTYNMLVSVCVRAADIAAALKAADMLRSTGLKLDVLLYTNLIKACSRAGDVNMAFKLYGELTKAGLQADCQVHNVLLSTCAEAMKIGNLERREQLVLLERAFHLFEDMEATNLQPDTSNWNALICCAARSGQLMRAFEMIERMQLNGCIPDVFTYSVLIDACGKARNKDLALKVYKRAMKECIEANVVLFTSAIQACISSDTVELETIFEIYNALEHHAVKPDAKFYASVIRAAGQAGNLDLAFALQEEMDADNIKATAPICSALIAAALCNDSLELATSVYHDFAERGIYPLLMEFNALIMAHARQSNLQDVIDLVLDLVKISLEPDVYTYTGILSALQRAEEAELAHCVAEMMKVKRIVWDEAICFTLLRICYNRLSASWCKEANEQGAQQHLQALSPAGSSLLNALAGQNLELPELCLSSDGCWVDRAVAIYKHSLSCDFRPTLKVLDRLFACLRVPNSKMLAHELFTPFNMAAHHLHEVQQLQRGQLPNDRCVLDIFDPRATFLAKEAISMGVLPQFSLDGQCQVDLRTMPPAVAEVYVLTIFSTMKERSERSRRASLHSITFLMPPYKGGDVFCGGRITKKAKDASDNRDAEPDDAQSGKTLTSSASSDTYTAHCSTSLGIVATLKRLRVRYKSNARKGRVWVEQQELARWCQAAHHSAWGPGGSAVKPQKQRDHGPIGESISKQRRSIRLRDG